MNTYTNPIIPGFYPDPSICRVGSDYYLITSTFTYFPGVPIFHSTDLVNWKQIGNILDRTSQVPLSEGGHSMGIFAPTLRYHEGTFYMITTNVCNGGNFIVTATDPAGPWSEPYWLGSGGIDPSLFFDEDGRCYYCGTKERREGGAYYGDNEIYVQELDLASMKLIGDSYAVWHGAAKDAIWAEGPHIYKKGGWYYLMISEGGTGHEHAVTIARSKEITGQFEGHKCNPILTHRHLGRDYPIVNVGHPDLVETQNGEWWMVMLASRPYGGYFRNLGRETFLAPVKWEDGWPLVNPGRGLVEVNGTAPDLPYSGTHVLESTEHFDGDLLPYHFIYLRNPVMDNYDLKARKGHLRMKLSPVPLSSLESPSYVGRRQQTMSYKLSAALDFEPNEGEQAGITLFQSNDYYYAFYLTRRNGLRTVELSSCKKGDIQVIASKTLDESISQWVMSVQADQQSLNFAIRQQEVSEAETMNIAEDVDGRMLSTDVAGGFVGTTIGMFATSNGQDTKNHVDFDWFTLI